MTFIGIDPGLRGAIAAIPYDDKVHVDLMPTKDGLMDVGLLADILGRYKNPIVMVEKAQSAPGQGVASTFKYGVGYGQVLATVRLVTGHPAALVRSPEWKKDVLHGYTHDKQGAIEFCQRNFYGVCLVPPGCRVPHDGMADALCIAEYCRRKYGF